MNWRVLFLNIPWILGLAIILAASSWARYQARHDRLSMNADTHVLRKRLSAPSFQCLFAVGLLLVSASLLLTSTSLWERVVWSLSLLVWIASLAQTGKTLLSRRR